MLSIDEADWSGEGGASTHECRLRLKLYLASRWTHRIETHTADDGRAKVSTGMECWCCLLVGDLYCEWKVGIWGRWYRECDLMGNQFFCGVGRWRNSHIKILSHENKKCILLYRIETYYHLLSQSFIYRIHLPAYPLPPLLYTHDITNLYWLAVSG